MSPKQSSTVPAQFAQYNIVALHNIDDEDFIFEYGRSENNPPYTIPAGEVRRYPKFIARHALKHLVDKILTKRNIKTNNEPARIDLAGEIVIAQEKYDRADKKTKADELKEKVKSLNKPSDLDQVLSKHMEEVKRKKQAEKAVKQDEEDEEFEGLDKEETKLKGNEEDTTVKMGLEESKEEKPLPTRKEIYAYAGKQGLALGEKEKKQFNKMPVEKLMKELGDPREAIR